MLSSEAEAWSQVHDDTVFISRFNHPITSKFCIPLQCKHENESLTSWSEMQLGHTGPVCVKHTFRNSIWNGGVAG